MAKGPQGMAERFQTYDVFLSYSSCDEHIANELAHQIKSAGLRCFMSAQDLPGGAVWNAALRDAIRQCEKILLLITPRSKNSKWISLETGAAWMLQKEIIPITQFVTPQELGNIASDYQVRIVETEQQRAALIADLKSPRKEPQVSFTAMLSKIHLALAKIRRDRIFPDTVIASGRDGAVCGAIFAELLGQKRMSVIYPRFSWRGKERDTDLDDSGLREENIKHKNLLVVEWARQTGETFSLISQSLQAVQPASVHSFALFWTRASDTPPDYYGFESDHVPVSPWSTHHF